MGHADAIGRHPQFVKRARGVVAVREDGGRGTVHPTHHEGEFPGCRGCGEVLAVGPGDFQDGERVPMDVKVGDLVVYSKYGGTEVKYEGEDYLILSARDVLAVIG